MIDYEFISDAELSALSDMYRSYPDGRVTHDIQKLLEKVDNLQKVFAKTNEELLSYKNFLNKPLVGLDLSENDLKIIEDMEPIKKKITLDIQSL